MSSHFKLLYAEDLMRSPYETDPYYNILAKEGYEVIVAKDGEEAWKKLTEERFDCVILDIMLPNRQEHIKGKVPTYRTGIHILEKIREGRFDMNEATPVIVASAIADLEDVRKIRNDLEPEVYLAKPFRPPELLNAVEKALEIAQ